MENLFRYRDFNTRRNSHVNLNTTMPMPPHPNMINRTYPYRNNRPFVSGAFNRVPPPPRLNNNA